MYNQSIDQIFKSLNSCKLGLSSSVAKSRQIQFGKNELDKPKKQSKWLLFFKQFCDVMIIVLCVAAIVSAIIGFSTKSSSELFDAFIVLLIVFLNAIIGFFQECKAEKAMDSLKKITQHYSKVYRDGKLTKIFSSELTVGDVVLLEAGDLVPADIRLFECFNLKISESVLTGESLASQKNAGTLFGNLPIADRSNMAFCGGVVENGRGFGVVCEIGMKTQMGQIAKALNSGKQEETLLQKKLNKTAKIITIICLSMSFLIFIASILLKMGILQAFMISVAIAVAAIPEGLPAIITIIMALGVQRLSKKRAIVKKLRAVETLGCTEIICSDKTGTLTQNKLTVKKEFCFDRQKTLECAFNCNNAVLGNQKIGDGLEIALLEFLQSEKIKIDKQKRINENPFDSKRKKMSVVCEQNGKRIVFCKGAPDVVLNDCAFILEKGNLIELTKQKKEFIKSKIKELGDEAFKVLGFAFKNYEMGEEAEANLVFCGLLGLHDPPRKEAKFAIEKCKEAGIKTVMITGDHKSTAVAIAKQLSLIKSENQVLTGEELDQLSDKQFEDVIFNINVFARVSPEHKVRVVKTFKKMGKVVAMTGDGVNDAPSLKEANIGIGMGQSGTEVAQNASDIVLADDNFATIVSSVEEGRKIYSNITKTIVFLLSANIAEMFSLLLITLFVAPFWGNLVFLIPAQILFINLITDALPAIALGVEPTSKDVMKKPPRKETSHLLANRTGFNIIYQGIVQTLIVVGVFLFGLFNYGNQTASTMALLTLNLIQLFHCFNSKSEVQSIGFTGIKNNKLLLVSFVLGFVLTVLVCTVNPLMVAFGVVKLNAFCWIISICSAFSIVPIVEFVKLLQRKKTKKA